MKKNIICLFLSFLLAGYGIVFAGKLISNQEQANQITILSLKGFVAALKEGDLDTMKEFMSEKMYTRYKTLLEENQGYSNFLRNYYKDARFSIGKISVLDDRLLADLHVDFSDGSRSVHHLGLLKAEKNFGHAGNKEWVFQNERKHIENKNNLDLFLD
ncbi:MAG: hypothetical protein U9R60_08465 [Bacteroidota bacterium]|nr:hypothetical protein [Bacteroidota bacterium]